MKTTDKTQMSESLQRKEKRSFLSPQITDLGSVKQVTHAVLPQAGSGGTGTGTTTTTTAGP